MEAPFLGADPGIGREFAFDPPTRLMWYASAENVIRSVNVDTLVAGPTITGVLGASVGADRHIFIDYTRRTLLAVLSDGSVQVFRLSAQLLSYTFTGTEPSGLYGIIAGLAQFGTLTVIGSLFEILVTFAP